MNIKEEYCSYEVSKLLKEKGFDEPCRSYFINNVDYIDSSYSTEELTDLHMGVCETLRPTHQMACAWLREKDIYMYIEPFITISSIGYNLEGYKPWVTTFKGNWFNPLHKLGKIVCTKTYEDAVEAALKYVLENLI